MKSSMKKFAVAVVMASTLGIVPSAWAITTYSYTGNHFSYVGTGPDVTNVSGSFSVESDLAANTTYNLLPSTVGGTITSYGFTDGRTSWNMGDYISNPASAFTVVTDTSGTIASWYLEIFNPLGFIFTCSTANFPCNSGFMAVDFVSVDYNYNAYNFSNPGTWLGGGVVSAVPEPETYAMLLAGLGLLGFTARRRKDHTA